MTEQWQIDYDRRQIKRMREHIQAYQEGRIDLGGLISGLRTLQSALETASDAWRAQFVRHWGILEEVYAVALDLVERGMASNVGTVISQQENQKLLSSVIAELKNLLANDYVESE